MFSKKGLTSSLFSNLILYVQNILGYRIKLTDTISRWRQRISHLCKIRGRLEYQLMRPKSMRVGSMVKQYMFCGKASCACHRDPKKKHGPYYYLSYKEKGQSHYKYLGKATSPEVERARNYQVFQRGMAQLGKMHREVIDLFWKIGETKMKWRDEE